MPKLEESCLLDSAFAIPLDETLQNSGGRRLLDFRHRVRSMFLRFAVLLVKDGFFNLPGKHSDDDVVCGGAQTL